MSDKLPENKKKEAETETDADQAAAESQVTATETSPSQETDTQLPAKQTETLPAKQTETLPAKQTETLQQTTEPDNRDPNRNQPHIDNMPECVLYILILPFRFLICPLQATSLHHERHPFLIRQRDFF